MNLTIQFMKNTHRIYTIVIVIFLILLNQNVFAQSSKRTTKILDAACIYKPNTTFLFTAVYDSAGTVQKEYMLMSILPDVYAGEIVILYSYYKNIPKIDGDSVVNIEDRIGIEETIMIDNKKYIELHPPRSGKYYFLSQNSPFPYMKLPVKEWEKSKRGSFTLKSSLNNGKSLWMKHKMQNSSKFQYQYKDSLIEVYEKRGKANSRIGEYSASYLFNEKLGFVKWTLVASNNISQEFTLIDTFPFLLKNYQKHKVRIKG